jgi:hypothetical protein
VLAYPYTEGQTVTYHGSHTDKHGHTYRAWICRCRRAHAVEQPRFMLSDPDTNKAVAWHVRPASLSPA